MVVYGKGAKGRAMDVVSRDPNDKETLAHLLQDAGLVQLYSLKHNAPPKELLGSDLNRLRNRLSSDMIAKRFLGKSAQESFMRELEAYRTLLDTYGSNALKEFTSVKTIHINGTKVIGIVIYDSEKRNPMHFIFNAKCDATLDKVPSMTRNVLVRLVFDILASIHLLQTSNRGHFDIKPDNIMMCGNGRKFKLIDWDLSHALVNHKDRHYGSKAFSSPISWYISKWGPLSLTIGSFGRIFRSDTDVFDHSELRQVLKTKVVPFYQKIFADADTKEEVYAKYKYTLDLYNLGMTLMYVIIKNGLLNDARDVVAFATNLLLANYKDAETAIQDATKLLGPPGAASTGRILQAPKTASTRSRRTTTVATTRG